MSLRKRSSTVGELSSQSQHRQLNIFPDGFTVGFTCTEGIVILIEVEFTSLHPVRGASARYCFPVMEVACHALPF